jgi:CelD/BcsL family acetyltransferase involved in cellulose biosynthesis
LRETIRRRTARALRDPAIELEMFRAGDGIERGIAAFEEVYRRSWKEPEPYPGFNAGFMRVAAGLGLLRLGVMWQDGRAIAAQYWVMTGGVAAVLKLAHDEAVRSLSPGTVLTAWMIKGLLGEGGVRELDFGRGDDPYKQGWTELRRQRIGFVLADPLRIAGFASILRHRLGRVRQALRSWQTARATA